MKRQFFFIIWVLVGMMVFGVADSSAQKKKKMMKELHVTALQDLKWEQAKDAPPGFMTATVWGNPEKGAYGGYVKFPAGLKFPLHYHTNDSKDIVISGMITVVGEDGKKFEFGAGAFAEVPEGWRHTTEVGPEGATVFEWSTKKSGMKMVEEKPMEK